MSDSYWQIAYQFFCEQGQRLVFSTLMEIALKIILSVLQIKGPHIFNMRILFMSWLLVLFSYGLWIKISWLEKFIRDSKSLGLFVMTSGSLFDVLIKKNCVEKEFKKFSFVFQINNKFIFMIKMLDTWCLFIA